LINGVFVSQENMSAKAAKAAAAAARQEAAAIEQKRQRKIRIIGGLVVVAVMAALIAIPVLSNKDAVVPTDAALPTGVTSDKGWIGLDRTRCRKYPNPATLGRLPVPSLCSLRRSIRCCDPRSD
jgi:hypothetical protein